MAELFKLVGTIAIDGTDVATQKINAVITAGTDLEKKLNGIGANADNSIGSNSGFGAASVWLGNTITELTKRATQLGKEFVLAGLKYNAAMEGYEVSFGTLLNGDIEKAKQLMADIQAFALDSPLSVSGVSDAALHLLNVGTDYEDVMPMLKMLGDLSLGDSIKMARLTNALSQVIGYGNLYGQEKQQFVNSGVPIWTLLEDYYKIAQGINPENLNLAQLQRAGNITTEDVLGALQLATMSSEEVFEKYGFSGERAVSFYNAMAAMLPTYTGQTQKAGEQTEITAGAIVKPYQDEATKSVLPAYTEAMGAVAKKLEGDETSKNVAESIGGFVTNMIKSFTDAVSGEFDVNAENENLTPFGKFMTGVYDWGDLWNSLRKKEVDPDASGGGGFRWGLPDGVDADGLGGNAGSLAGTLAALQGTLSSLPAQIEAAASNGVATGVSGITVTGTITTGNVMLNTGALVGQLTPKLNLTLGNAFNRASRG